MGWVYLASIIVIFLIMLHITLSYSDSSGQGFGRHIYKKVCEIENATSQSNEDSLKFINKNKQFTIQIKKEAAPGLRYETIPAYFCKNIYINDELVCKIHVLDGLFRKKYSTEFSSKREETEILGLLNIAYKYAKRLNRESWQEFLDKQSNLKSFYDK